MDSSPDDVLRRTVDHLLSAGVLREDITRPRLFAVHLDNCGGYQIRTVDTATAGTGPPDTSSTLHDLTRRVTAGVPLTYRGQPIRPPDGLILIHAEHHGLPGHSAVLHILDAINTAGATLVASAHPDQPDTTPEARHVPPGRRPVPAALHRLMFALTRDQRLLRYEGDVLLTPWLLFTDTPTPPAGSGGDHAEMSSIGARAVHLATAITSLAADQGLDVDWQQAGIDAAIDPHTLQVWLNNTARLLALDLMQMLVAATFDQLSDIADSPADWLASHAHHVANLADTWLDLQHDRQKLLTRIDSDATALGLFDTPQVTAPADDLTGTGELS